jgi:ABC-2 type transport system permease protein
MAGPVEWLAAAGLIVLIAFAVSWVGVAMGMQSKTVETASNLPLILTILPLLGSGFVPTGSMPVWMQWFAQYQPFTPFIETVRGLLLGIPLGWNTVLAIGWSVVIAMAGYAWSMVIYERKSVR